ncbi:MAG: enoyl-CoA hydratase-related protein [Caulobacterales bacterium]
MSEHVKINKKDGVLEIVFARPERKNALTNAMYVAAAEALENANIDQDVRVVLIAGEGDAFSAGNDLGDFSAFAAGKSEELQAWRFIKAIGSVQKPVVAAVQGLAIGVGATMLLHCDLVYVADDAKLTVPFVNLALAPEAASSMLLPARIGHARAFAMFTLGEGLSGQEAYQLGLANKVAPREEVLGAARAAALALTQRPIGSVLMTKKLMRETEAILARMDEESALFKERLKTGEAKEAFNAFSERRPADFSKFS